MNEQIFISYRRDGGDITAKLICEALKNQGYSVFYDYDSINGGFFDERIFESIDKCNDFILVLSKNALDRCANEGDWVRQEICYALKHNKHIIPVMLENFAFPSNLPADIKDIERINAVHFIMAYFEGVIDAIKKRLISRTGNTVPVNQANEYISKNLKFTFDEDLKGYCVSCGKCKDTEIRIPDVHEGKAVVAIAEDGFRDCSALQTVVLPETLRTIGDGAFYGCSSLKNVLIPDNVTTIGKWAFYECGSLPYITIPRNVRTIKPRAFAKCTSLLRFEVDPDNRYYCAHEENLYTKDMGIFMAYPCGKRADSCTVPEGVIKIDDSAFSQATFLSAVTLPSTLTQIDKFAFKNSTLVDVTIPDGVQVLEEDCFRGCSALQTAVLPETLKQIGESAFYECSSLKNIQIPGNVTDIGKWAFYKCSSIESIALPKTVKNIGARAFAQCTSLLRFEVDPDNRYFCAHEGNLYTKDMGIFMAYACGKRTDSCTVPEGVTKIDDSAFSEATFLSAITLPGTLTLIDKFAFKHTALINVTIPEGVQAIEDDAFRECSSLVTALLPKTLKTIGESAFYQCGCLKNIQIPGNVTDIGKWAFYKCSSIESIALPKTVRNIGARAFAQCTSLKNIDVSIFNRAYCAKKNVLFSKDMKMLHAYPIGSGETSYKIPNNVTVIGDSAFSNSTLEHITIGSKVAQIEEYSFYVCKKLKNIYFEGSVDAFKQISLKSNSFLKAQTNQVHCNDGVVEV